jgi:hypothetical protein
LAEANLDAGQRAGAAAQKTATIVTPIQPMGQFSPREYAAQDEQHHQPISSLS